MHAELLAGVGGGKGNVTPHILGEERGFTKQSNQGKPCVCLSLWEAGKQAEVRVWGEMVVQRSSTMAIKVRW